VLLLEGLETRSRCVDIGYKPRIPRISSPSYGRLASCWPTTVHSRRGNSTTTTTPSMGGFSPSLKKSMPQIQFLIFWHFINWFAYLH